MPDIKVKGYSGTDLAYENVEKIWLTSKSGSGRETLFAEQELTFTTDDPYGYICTLSSDIGFSVGDSLTVVIDGEEYDRTAVDAYGFAFIGNMSVLDGADTGEPFTMVSDGTWLEGTVFADTPTHTVAIYKGSSAPALIPYTYGELLDGVQITPNFVDGDQHITVPDGSLVKKATILKPDTLRPENIKQGVEIAGITGDYVPETEEVTVELDMADGNQTITPSEGKLLAKATVKRPETLVPENILLGVEIGGVAGSAVPEPETEGATVTLDFSGGDMTVEPTEGKFLSRVDIPKPDTLTPENIAKDVMIAGVVGTLESAGVTDIASADEMNALLVAENVGKVYRYTGDDTDDYTSGDLYEVEEGVA